jgi:nicotinamide mononucleotide transporter
MSVHDILHNLFEQARSQNVLEIAALLSGIMCVWQTVRENAWCWITGTVNVVLIAYLVFQAGLFADFALQILYVLLNAYGFYQWLHGGEKRSELHISTTPLRMRLLLFAGVLPLMTLLLSQILHEFQPDSTTYMLDAYTTSLSICAQMMLAHKKLENWGVWITANIIYIGLYGYKGLYYLAFMQIVFIALSIKGWRDWRVALLKQRASDRRIAPVQFCSDAHGH